MSPSRPPRRQRGFALILVMLLMVLMVGVAAIVLSSTQEIFRLAREDGESVAVFYAGETGVAMAKDWLRGQAPAGGLAAWQPILNSGAPQICQAGGLTNYQPWATPGTAPTQYDAPPRSTFWNFCIRNNSLDPSFTGGNGNRTDSDGIVTIEAFGFGPSGLTQRVTVDVGITGSTVLANDYVQAGGTALKQGLGDTRTVTTNQSVNY